MWLRVRCLSGREYGECNPVYLYRQPHNNSPGHAPSRVVLSSFNTQNYTCHTPDPTCTLPVITLFMLHVLDFRDLIFGIVKLRNVLQQFSVYFTLKGHCHGVRYPETWFEKSHVPITLSQVALLLLEIELVQPNIINIINCRTNWILNWILITIVSLYCFYKRVLVYFRHSIVTFITCRKPTLYIFFKTWTNKCFFAERITHKIIRKVY